MSFMKKFEDLKIFGKDEEKHEEGKPINQSNPCLCCICATHPVPW